jgi:hypothetical protein
MIALMRDLKNHYFFKPPLTPEDFAALGLKVPGANPADPGAPWLVLRNAPFRKKASLGGFFFARTKAISLVAPLYTMPGQFPRCGKALGMVQ